MKTASGLLATVMLSCVLVGPAVAQQRSPKDTAPPPRGTEGPELRKEAPKDTGKAKTPKTDKKGSRARGQKPGDTQSPVTGVEGPEMRRQRPDAPSKSIPGSKNNQDSKTSNQ
jgi:hypothetical protein